MVKPKLLDQVRRAIRVRHLSYRTERTYVDWIKRSILSCPVRNFVPLPPRAQQGDRLG
jgi:hypothetical protein